MSAKEKSQAEPSIKKLAKSWGISPSEITKEGDNLTVGGSLYLRGTQITALPDNLTVGGSLYLHGTGIACPKNLKQPEATLSKKIQAAIEVKFNAKGFTIADGILAAILSVKGAVKKICIVGKKTTSYLVGDGNGNFAHGKTIKEAREDLIYKVVAKFDGKLPKKATGKEWIGIYRAVTGACGAGVRHFVESTGKSLEDEYTAKQIAALVKGQYGAERFAEKLKEAA